ncbi:hypothetical protein WR25_24529 [Diploscapter pachys]|uniref:DUF19 domain-containing protein n=1 Tax=Diploscapter pachys TaxID=2018661 RepID=A0A2A2JR80_9BILA|nr:hypothetical protein WR25_24529 [Diploscapter pachys]
MRIYLLLSAIFYYSTAAPSADLSTCNYVGLVKCFINILDEWAWTLYELKDNVVTITQDQCVHLEELQKCIQDGNPVAHNCKHSEIVEVSNTVSDLLTHRRNSGSFLKSYYLLTYACSQEGQEILANHRECLKSEKIGEMTLSAGTYLTEKFIEHGDDEICDKVNEKLQEYISAMTGLCSKHDAAQLMCKSLIMMFKGMHPDKMEGCNFDCKIPAKEEEEGAEEENAVPSSSEDQNVEQKPNGHSGLQHQPDSAPQITSIMSLFTIMLTYMVFRN